MATALPRQASGQAARRSGLRGRLLISFMIPVLLLGAGAVVLVEMVAAGGGTGLPIAVARGILAGFILLALLTAAALGLQTGDRLTRPVAWLLRAIDAGQVRMLSQLPPPAADWELGILCNRVRVLLRQNLSGAKALEELEALRSEIGAVLRAARAGRLDETHWPPEDATHELTQTLLSYFRDQRERARDAAVGLGRLQAVLEQDWRDQTQSVEELIKRAERTFLQQTQLAVETERVERLAQIARRDLDHWTELAGLLKDLQLGIERWRREVDGHLAAAGYLAAETCEAEAAALSQRLRDWDAWVTESLGAIDGVVNKGRTQQEAGVRRLAAGLNRVSEVVAGAGQEVSALSQEVVQLQRAWGRLGERLRSLMVRVDETHNGGEPMRTSPEEEPEDDAGR